MGPGHIFNTLHGFANRFSLLFRCERSFLRSSVNPTPFNLRLLLFFWSWFADVINNIIDII
jgi:hypothetical protein